MNKYNLILFMYQTSEWNQFSIPDSKSVEFNILGISCLNLKLNSRYNYWQLLSTLN